MLFSSLVFLLFFLPMVLALYFLCSFSRRVQNVILFFASIFFYAWGEPRFVVLILGSIVVNYFFGLLVDKNRKKAKSILIFAVMLNVGVLFVFKYLNFVVRNINGMAEEEFLFLNQIALPLGISFFTFQALSYVIDVYRGDAPVEKNLMNVGLYIAFFPQLIAGPIVRFNSIAEQIRYRKISIDKFSVGCSRFAMGFCKKILLANNFAIVADHIFQISLDGNNVVVVPVLLAWLGAVAYTLQIFYDFSAYSDMAIGLGLLFGFQFQENFNYPYISKSVGEFWRRWHISLSTWFREYVYIPLGGSRLENKDKVVRNLFVVWMLTGIWHGAEWTFFLWGFLNFILILGERFIDFEERKLPGACKHLYLMLAVIMGWVLFRAENLTAAMQYTGNLFGMNDNGFFSDMALMFIKEYGVFFVVGILFCMPISKRCTKLMVENKMPIWDNFLTVLYPVVLFLLFVISVSYLVKGTYNPFIYFNF